jgi:hypothetical protein
MAMGEDGFIGRWFTTFGPLFLRAEGDRIVGTYRYGATEGHVEGVASGDVLRFTYHEPNGTGEGSFHLVRTGKFRGTYAGAGESQRQQWDGERGWNGIWDTDFGRMRLIQEGLRVHGTYEGAGSCSLEGNAKSRSLEFRYREGEVGGEGRFLLNEEDDSFTGEWRAHGRVEWAPWKGRRLVAAPGLTWLVVLEAHWQRSLAEPEYAFGHMLREVFAHLATVRVRQRFFHDAQSLEHWCRELLYLAEPAILIIASHGLAEGLSVHGEVINASRVFDSVRCAEKLRLVHFSSCLVGRDGEGALGEQPYPVSGYTTDVDWGVSALIEFNYLDLILNRGLTPADAAAALPGLVTYAGDIAPAGSPYVAAGFRFFPGR